MAIITKTTEPGNELNSTLGGNVQTDEGKGRILISDAGIRVAVFGKDDSGRTVVKIAEEGVDVLTASDDQLIFNSNQNVLKIVSTGKHTVSYSFAAQFGSGFTVQTKQDAIAHNFGRAPAMMVFMEFNNGGVTSYVPVASGSLIEGSSGAIGFTLASTMASGFGFAATQARIYVDTANLYLGLARWCNLSSGSASVTIPAESGSVTFKYYLFQETAS